MNPHLHTHSLSIKAFNSQLGFDSIGVKT